MIYLIYPHAEHEHLKKLMKKLMRPIITIGLGFILALFSAALTYSSPPAMEGTFGGAAAFFMQPHPQTESLRDRFHR
jgi:hypothetical protein